MCLKDCIEGCHINEDPENGYQDSKRGTKKSSDTFIDCQDIFCCSFIILVFCFSAWASFFLSLVFAAALYSSVHVLISSLHSRS